MKLVFDKERSRELQEYKASRAEPSNEASMVNSMAINHLIEEVLEIRTQLLTLQERIERIELKP